MICACPHFSWHVFSVRNRKWLLASQSPLEKLLYPFSAQYRIRRRNRIHEKSDRTARVELLSEIKSLNNSKSREGSEGSTGDVDTLVTDESPEQPRCKEILDIHKTGEKRNNASISPLEVDGRLVLEDKGEVLN